MKYDVGNVVSDVHCIKNKIYDIMEEVYGEAHTC